MSVKTVRNAGSAQPEPISFSALGTRTRTSCLSVRRRERKRIYRVSRSSGPPGIKPDFRITKEHGVWFERGGYDMCALYHPSALLRDPRKKEDMLTDMKALKEKYDLVRG